MRCCWHDPGVVRQVQSRRQASIERSASVGMGSEYLICDREEPIGLVEGRVIREKMRQIRSQLFTRWEPSRSAEARTNHRNYGSRVPYQITRGRVRPPSCQLDHPLAIRAVCSSTTQRTCMCRLREGKSSYMHRFTASLNRRDRLMPRSGLSPLGYILWMAHGKPQ
jgi:hypothetical protein